MKITWEKLRSWLRNFSRGAKEELIHRVKKRGVNPANYEYPSAAYASVGIIYLIFAAVLFTSGFLTGSLIWNEKSSESQTLAATKSGLISSNEDLENLNSSLSGCLFEGGWKQFLGALDRRIGEPGETLVSLPFGENSGSFKYTGTIDQGSRCDFRFVPRSDKAINYLISFDEFYQVVIGDNDYYTISLRAVSVLGGRMNPEPETKSGKERPRLTRPILKGSETTVSLYQEEVENDKYQVRVVVNYSPDLSGDEQKTKEEFVWKFKTSPILITDDPDLSVGLIRGANDSSYIGSNFISPNLDRIVD